MEYLGSLEKTYKIKPQSKISAFVLCVLFLGFGAVLIGLLFFNDDLFFDDSGESAVPLVLFVYSLTLLVGFMGVFLAYTLFRTRKDNLCLYENGLILIHKGKNHTAKWDEIESLGESAVQVIVNGLPSAVNYSFSVTKFDGENFTVHSLFKEMEEIGERLKGEVFKRQMPVIINRFNRGETVKFGRFSINQSYLFSEKRGQLPLSEIENIEVVQGSILIRKKDKRLTWDRAKYGSIPNAGILLTIWGNIRL